MREESPNVTRVAIKNCFFQYQREERESTFGRLVFANRLFEAYYKNGVTTYISIDRPSDVVDDAIEFLVISDNEMTASDEMFLADYFFLDEMWKNEVSLDCLWGNLKPMRDFLNYISLKSRMRGIRGRSVYFKPVEMYDGRYL